MYNEANNRSEHMKEYVNKVAEKAGRTMQRRLQWPCGMSEKSGWIR